MNDRKKILDDAGCTEEWIDEKLKHHTPAEVTMMSFYRLANRAMEDVK